MIFKFGVLITLLSVTIYVATSETTTDEPFSVENVWKETCSSNTKPDWIKPVQKYYDDAIASFSTFPEVVTGPADLVKTTFKTLLTKVIKVSCSESDVLSSGATAILESFALVNQLDNHSASGIIDEFYRVLPALMKAYRKVVKKLTKIIGHRLVDAVNTAINDLESEFKAYVIKFEAGGGKVEVGYESVLKRAQKLADTIALKGDAKLTEVQLKDPKVKDALILLRLILEYIMILVHGLSSSSQAVLLEQNVY